MYRFEFNGKDPNGYTTTPTVKYLKALHRRMQVLHKRAIKQGVDQVNIISTILDNEVERYFSDSKVSVSDLKKGIDYLDKRIPQLRNMKYNEMYVDPKPNLQRMGNKELERVFDFVVEHSNLHEYTRVNVQDSIVICDGFKSLTFHANRLPIFYDLVGEFEPKRYEQYIKDIKNAGIGKLGEFLEETAIQPMFCTTNGKIYFVFSHTSLEYDYILEVKF